MTPLPVMNTQRSTPPTREENGEVLVLQGEPFATIQGEGPFSGHPATFVRTWGCNLSCDFCDTDYTSNPRLWHISRLLATIAALAKPVHHTGRPLVVITGGEPFRQPVGTLIWKLVLADYTVQIETNGTLFRDDLPWLNDKLFVVCSPKAPKVRDRLYPYVSAWKYPIRAGEVDEQDGLPTKILGGPRPFRPSGYSSIGQVPIYVTPMSEGDGSEGVTQLNRMAAVKSAMKFGYVMQEQSHILWGLK